jgi:preprotein translocase subunit Sec63
MNAKKSKRISEKRFEAKLAQVLTAWLDSRGGYASTFEDNGVMTMNKGLVVTLPNGQEFQLTIVESTRR